MRTDYFGDRDFDLLLTLLNPFDTTFPAIQIHADRLLYELAVALSNGGADETFDEFRERGIQSRKNRGAVFFHPKSEIVCLFNPLVKIITLIALQFPAINEHTDRVVYELGKALGTAVSMPTFEEFHLEHRLIRSVVNSKTRGVG
jgi:hypothetical protein